MAECDFPPIPVDGRLYCNATYDGVQCWNHTLAGTTAIGACPEGHPASAFFDNPTGFSFRKCEINGLWWNNNNNGTHEFAKTNYLPCLTTDALGTLRKDNRIKLILHVYISGYAVSVFLLVVALIIFGIFKQLHCSRVTIHSNLFLSYILSNSCWIVFYAEMSLSNFQYDDRPTWCYVLHGFTQYTTLCNYAWMLSEGIFLHFCLVHVFSDRKRLVICCCIVGWVFPAIVICIYCTIRIITGEGENERCWTEKTWTFWIILIPVILSLLINLIFLINILRILLSKLRSVTRRDNDQYKKTGRAILILVPLLGLHYILMPLNNDSFTYKITVAILTSYQGAAVAVLFCFLNGQVSQLIRRKLGLSNRCAGSPRSTERTFFRSSIQRSSLSRKEEFALTDNAGPNCEFLPHSPDKSDN
ncbi:calcitonin gene-related peptide type 1 receptor-like isoform X2 [Ostrea edulis]|uniref:calcitonin gene-related peptide type 1 receptor-like isoform X2 n=1 Tax=Ostrea edulis TaxID=37623 RepID=UPI002095F6C0|nr:calcitonin gene-related peptide type 1 receptor-like isoform X2 [Ostrea edulis]